LSVVQFLNKHDFRQSPEEKKYQDVMKYRQNPGETGKPSAYSEDNNNYYFSQKS